MLYGPACLPSTAGVGLPAGGAGPTPQALGPRSTAPGAKTPGRRDPGPMASPGPLIMSPRAAAGRETQTPHGRARA